MDYILKYIPEDFIVEEITPNGEFLEINKKYSYSKGEGKFLHAVLEKRNIDTMQAAQKISLALGARPERITYAGVKDKQAVSAQRISFYKVEKESAEKISIPNIKISLTGRGDKIALGMLFGNRFTITLRNIEGKPEKIKSDIESSTKKVNGYFPNYFGPQRFGTTRPVSAICGKLILQGKFKEVVETYICKTFDGEPDDIKKIRRTAKKDRNKALALFPRKYAYERAMLAHLIERPDDYISALRRLPPGLQKMLVHAYQSQIFNEALKLMEKDNLFDPTLEIPLVGSTYTARIFETPADKYIKKILKKEKIKPENFNIKEFPEISSEGNSRKAFEKIHDFEVLKIAKDEVFEKKQKVVLRFKLAKGCYATVLLQRVLDS